MEDLDSRVSDGESFYIIGELPTLPASWKVEHDLPCAQMLLPAGAGELQPSPSGGKAMQPSQTASLPGLLPGKESVAISLLGDADAAAMFDLINSVQPGYYNIDTRLLGTYYGIRQGGRLVAMAGERMRMTGFSELSAICTHPEYTGRGYAQQLITQLCLDHAKAGIVSFLHVALSNQRAIRLYEHMGFEHRSAIHFRRVKKEGAE